MSDFQDFLKHKFAYVAIGEFKAGKFEEAQRLYEQAIATYGEGFQGTYLMQEPGTDRGIAIIFWESAADMEANRNEANETILKQMAPLFASHPITSFCEVVCEIQPEDESDDHSLK
ncbi:antibiotic biosynthesis monooxygenase [Leptolyngbya sp. NK1-12]|uniref:Antibiotic biosynthesis monooxygenase n=1 Tax=Leptolyngbya sp. NK1-12 TaxID=2547451 RepID=A0AA96WB75_9CYAN|nr:antibiotic biosynthesis monooxygenase [Leptolyngbya sp. NK1-12]WNZ21853.1 antibiotic biosynthesis monooxygenase [Leptolyngbya sp. NK1-12]